MILPSPDEEDEITDSSMGPVSVISRMLFRFSCDVQKSELWSNKVVSLAPVRGVCCVLPSVWKTIEEPTIGLSIRGCDEETSKECAVCCLVSGRR